MPNILALENAIVAYMTRTATSDFNINSNSDILLLGLNNARRYAERAHDFYYAQNDCFLSVGSTGSPFSAAYIDTSVTAAGTLSPNVAGSFALAGTRNSLPFYTRTVASVDYFLSYTGAAWLISTGGFTQGLNYWIFTTTSANPAGSYTPHGTNTGTLTITQATGTIAIKRISNVLLPIAGGYYVPIEFTTNDEWNERIQRLYGREHYNSVKTLDEIGISQFNAVAVQQGQTISLQPTSMFTFPVVAQLSITQWMPDYAAGTDTDYFTERAPDFMIWRAIIEINNYFKVFAKRQEGNIDEAFVSSMADAALAALIAWDTGIATGTTTPIGETPVAMPSNPPKAA